MPYLDVCRLFFKPSATIEDETSVFSKEWRMTLEYVLQRSGLDALYTSRLGIEFDLWVFLLWETEDDRTNFYYQTTGFGFVSKRMAKAPSVFLFGDDSYEALGQMKDWTIDTLGAEIREAGNVNHTEYSRDEPEVLEQHLSNPLNQYSFVARQEREVTEKLYQGNVFKDAIIGILESNLCNKGNLTRESSWARYFIEIQKHEPVLQQICTSTEVPADIADLVGRKPQDYGVLSYDESRYSDTAYPMSLTFRPMSTLPKEYESTPESDRHDTGERDTGEDYVMCVVSLLANAASIMNNDDDMIGELRNKVGLQDGSQGLREVSILRKIDSEEGPPFVRFLCAWHSSGHFDEWKQKSAGNNHCIIEWSWTSKKPGLQLDWDSRPLTSDNQSWQDVDKILEVVEFALAEAPSPAEMETVEQRIYALTSTMSSSWSGDVDARPVVYAEDPVWVHRESQPPSCLLFIAWDGPEQRTAWLRNFMANSFTWTGHLAHILGKICARVESQTYSMDRLYIEHVKFDMAIGVNDESDGSESDHDMGF